MSLVVSVSATELSWFAIARTYGIAIFVVSSPLASSMVDWWGPTPGSKSTGRADRHVVLGVELRVGDR